VSNHHSAGKSIEHIAEDGVERGGVAYVASSNSMDSRGSQIPFRAQQGAPDVVRFPALVQIDDGQLDDPMMTSRVKAGRLAVDYRERTRIQGTRSPRIHD
jgi:hypothetical protein